MAQRDLRIGQPSPLGAQHDGGHALGRAGQMCTGQVGCLADVAGRGAQVAHSGGQGEGHGHRGQRFFKRWVDACVFQHVQRTAGQGYGLRLGGYIWKFGLHQDQFGEAHCLDGTGRRTHVSGVAGVHHNEANT
ncbi:hypothetical protein D3C73_1402990 [compost metagenome]